MRIGIIDLKSILSDKVFLAVEKTGADYQIFEHDVKKEDLKDIDGLVLTGSHDTVFDGGRLIDKEILLMGKPVLGVCYGHQLVQYLLGGKVVRSKTPEIKKSVMVRTTSSKLFKDLPKEHKVFMYHSDEVIKMATGFEKIAETDDCFYAGSQNEDLKIYTVQFHPEAEGNDYGDEIYRNFIDIVRESLL